MYLARRGNTQFHIQDTDMELYADNGYTILKETYKEVEDVKTEAATISGRQMKDEEVEEEEG